MTKFALNKQKGSCINHPAVGRLDGGIAKEITDEQANMLKHIYNIIIFDGVVMIDNQNIFKE